ncbi:hypothetical protein VL4N_15360 [Vagococcus lutrae]|uniref:DNA helicase UvrB n=1 Tax=Vagococcus lutrae TaxID=81947 RepID=UPI00192742D3|nr:DNA helicase UvrB [Vagococcus lutrae]GEQ62189.1 hypothetical protein VL2N_15250 [Vagococcus lutrae]GEQ64095.1 hypothetical protein VL3N_15370 [Vagococcus lutrae]GEQ65986.1 hypothetical protein VL4N_15360 [Vagococcus lutrae]
MNLGRLDFGTKDAVLAIAIMTMLILTIYFHWSIKEFILSEIAIVLSFYGGT